MFSITGDGFRHSLMVGMSFGLTSAVITTLGLMVGLHSGTHSKLVVLGEVFTIAFGDEMFIFQHF